MHSVHSSEDGDQKVDPTADAVSAAAAAAAAEESKAHGGSGDPDPSEKNGAKRLAGIFYNTRC